MDRGPDRLVLSPWYDKFLSATAAAVLRTDLDGSIVGWSDAAARFYGYDDREVVGKPLAWLWSEDAYPSDLTDLRGLFLGQAKGPFPARHRMSDGLVVEVHVTAAPFIDPVAHSLTGAIVLVTEVDSESMLGGDLSGPEVYRLMFDASPMPMYVYDAVDLHFVTVNDAALRFYGYSREAFLQLSVLDVQSGGEHRNFHDRILARATTPNHGMDVEHRDSKGRPLQVRISARPFLNEGHVCRLVAVQDRTAEVRKDRARLRAQAAAAKNTDALITTLLTTVGQHDPYIVTHQDRVADLATRIAQRLSLPKKDVEGIQVAARVHDIGKVGLPSEILNFPGHLSKPAFELVKTHAQAGADIIGPLGLRWPVARMILEHHERLDGSGYPHGLTREQLHIGSRIISVADVTEAISSHRPYREAQGMEAALTELRAGRAVRYEADVVDTCLELFEGDYTFPNMTM